MTLDQAQDEFRAIRNSETAQTYLNEVHQYWADEMVGDATLKAAETEIYEWQVSQPTTILTDPRTGSEWTPL